MKKLTSILACLILGVTSVFAQNAFVGGHSAWTFALQGGALYSINENGFSYRENGAGMKLFSLQGSAAIGYEFTNALGVRVSVGYGDNRSAANTVNTAAHGFYPYNFRNVNGFLDLTLDAADVFLIHLALVVILQFVVDPVVAVAGRVVIKPREQPVMPAGIDELTDYISLAVLPRRRFHRRI